MKSRKTMGEVIKAVLLVLAIACLYVGVQQFSRIRPAASYEDMGVHRFSPYRALPTQVKNTATGRQGRLHPTKTVWLVYYKATDGILYEWKKSVSSRTEAESIVSGGEIVERRVLSIHYDRFKTDCEELRCKTTWNLWNDDWNFNRLFNRVCCGKSSHMETEISWKRRERCGKNSLRWNEKVW